MKLVLLFAAVVGVALGEVRTLRFEETTAFNYHARFGIPEATRIKHLEEARDFDGARIVGGSPAPLGAHPHLGGLLINLTTGQQSMCGSSLVSNTKLVTAAHCWYDGTNQGNQITVVLGSLTLFYGGTRVIANNIVTHGSWNPNSSVQNDIAVITIPWIGYNNIISNIQLPTGTWANNNFAGQWAQAAGYGLQNSGSTNWNQAQHHVNLQVITNAVCSNTFGNNIVSSTICTSGAGGVSTCSGDSGGPLAITSGNSKILIGVTSFGSIFGCTLGFPAAFARVTSFISFIQNNM